MTIFSRTSCINLSMKKESAEPTTRVGKKPIIPQEKQDKIFKAIVQIKSKVDVPFVGDVDTVVNTLGFIVSVEKGIIAVPKKVARIGPSVTRIIFHNGEEARGTAIYTDTIIPLGFIMIEKDYLANNKDKLEEIVLGSTETQFYADYRVVLMGASVESEPVSKEGKVVNSNRNFANRYGALFQSNFDSTSNLNGAPIFNDKALCVGMHILSNESASYGLKVEYIKNYLKYFLDENFDGSPYKRGDIGLSITLNVVAYAMNNHKLPSNIAEEIVTNQNPTGGSPQCMMVSSIVPRFETEKLIKPGDIIYKVDNKVIKTDFLEYDNIINNHVGKDLDLVLYREGIEIKATVKVPSTDSFRIKSFVKFAGAYFHDITLYARSILNTNEDGIYLTYMSPNSAFSGLSTQSTLMKNNYILTAINGEAISNVKEFVRFLKKNCSEQIIDVVGIDLNDLGKPKTPVPIDLPYDDRNVRESSFTHFGGWSSKNSDLDEYCQDRTENFIPQNDDPVYEDKPVSESKEATPGQIKNEVNKSEKSGEGSPSQQAATTKKPEEEKAETAITQTEVIKEAVDATEKSEADSKASQPTEESTAKQDEIGTSQPSSAVEEKPSDSQSKANEIPKDDKPTQTTNSQGVQPVNDNGDQRKQSKSFKKSPKNKKISNFKLKQKKINEKVSKIYKESNIKMSQFF